MPNSRDLVPAGLWPLHPHSPQVGRGQGAGYVLPPSGPAAWPNFALDYGLPEAAGVVAVLGRTACSRGMSRQRSDKKSPPIPAAGQ